MSNEARQIVQAGLDRRKADLETAAREARLERYEQDQIRCCNEHSANAKVLRLMDETGRMQREQVKARQAAREQALAMEMAREQAATDAVKRSHSQNYDKSHRYYRTFQPNAHYPDN